MVEFFRSQRFGEFKRQAFIRTRSDGKHWSCVAGTAGVDGVAGAPGAPDALGVCDTGL
jgi:hypothetical protein